MCHHDHIMSDAAPQISQQAASAPVPASPVVKIPATDLIRVTSPDPAPSPTASSLPPSPQVVPAPVSLDSLPAQIEQLSAEPSNDPVAPAPAAELPALPNAQPGQTSLLDILVEQGSLTRQQADSLILDQASTGKSLENLLTENHVVSDDALVKARAKFYNIPFAQLDEIGVSPEAISMIPESVARRYKMLPFAINKPEHILSVAMINPLDLAAIDFAEKQTGFHLQAYFASPKDIERMISERYSQNLSGEVNEALAETKLSASQNRLGDLSALSKEVVREAPINKIVETILAYAVKSRASDVHIEPQEDRTRVRYRIDGILTEKLVLPRTVHEAVVSRIKILSDLKIDEKRLPQDGRFSFTADGENVDLRVSTLPTIHGEKVEMRLLKKDASVPSLTELGLTGRGLRDLEEVIKIPHGIILITGPTGSGKTTTLYSLLHQINTPKVNISTLEDPVEYQMPGINQVQVNPQVGLTFASGLRAFLRQDPNVIMVGEIRDNETAELAIQAALTGHLVFSTLHTNSAAGALPRLIDMGAEPFLLASSLTLSMGQRVLRRLNAEYKEEYIPEQVVIDDIKKVLGPLFPAWCTQHKKDPNQVTLFKSKADRPPDEPEYEGRVAIFEVLRITEAISKMILEQKSAAEIEAVALEHGMLLMKQDGYLKALEGLTTIEEVLRVAEV